MSRHGGAGDDERPSDRIGERQLIDFVVREARLLDEKRYDEWYDLFTDDGFYWVPLVPDQPDGARPHLAPLRGQAAARAAHRAPEEPARVLAAAAEPLPPPAADADGRVERSGWQRATSCAREFHYTEAQGDELQLFVGTAFHHLTVDDGALRMTLKRVDLLNCDAALPAVQLFI